MLSTLVHHRARRLAAAALLIATAAACRDSTAPHDDHADEANAIRLTITAAGIQPRVVTFTSGQAPATLQIPVGTSSVSVAWLADDGDVLTLDADYVIAIDQVNPAGAMTFTRLTPTTGTISAPAAGTATARVCLMHVNHCDLSFTTVPVTIN